VKNSFDEFIFPSEPLSQKHYFDFFNTLNTAKVIEYHSAYRTNFDVILRHTENSYKTAISNNIIIEKIQKFDIDLLKILFAFSNNIFSKNWGFVPLNFQEFAELYNKQKIENYVGSVYLAKSDKKILGFA